MRIVIVVIVKESEDLMRIGIIHPNKSMIQIDHILEKQVILDMIIVDLI